MSKLLSNSSMPHAPVPMNNGQQVMAIAAFRELLKKVGSGTHTNENLSRNEARDAMRMMLLAEAAPAQIGAFMIAHRIRRPTGEELAGMLDAYEELGPALKALPQKVVVLGNPYDGRSRTAPVSPITALILATAGQPVIMHGGTVMPTKYGIPLVEIWQGLGVDWTQLSLLEVQTVLEKVGIGFVYLPNHFPLAHGLVTYRDQLGKRPPLATMELIWCPYAGDVRIIAGYVHPPTEEMFQTALGMRGVTEFTTIKGLEGSVDLPRDRTAIIGNKRSPFFTPVGAPPAPEDRILLHPRDYGFGGKEVPLTSLPQLLEDTQNVLQGKPSELTQAAIWNGGFYLWHCGICPDLPTGLAKAEALLTKGEVAQTLQKLIQTSNFKLQKLAKRGSKE